VRAVIRPRIDRISTSSSRGPHPAAKRTPAMRSLVARCPGPTLPIARNIAENPLRGTSRGFVAQNRFLHRERRRHAILIALVALVGDATA